MPIKQTDPFSYNFDGLSDSVNPYVEILRNANRDGGLPLAFGSELAKFPGSWVDRVSAYHARDKKYDRLVVEIGCHQGQTLLAMAKAEPNTLFIGVDITFKRVVMTAQRAKKLGLRNVFVLLANAKTIAKLFAPNEVDGCIVFFPDPWVKKARQAKNRLIDAAFCQQLDQILVRGGFCWLKTDQPGYFQMAATEFEGVGFRQQQELFPSLIGADYSSTFEQRFKLKNLATYGGVWQSSWNDS